MQRSMYVLTCPWLIKAREQTKWAYVTPGHNPVIYDEFFYLNESSHKQFCIYIYKLMYSKLVQFPTFGGMGLLVW